MKFDKPIQLEISNDQIKIILEKTKRIFVLHLEAVDKPDVKMLILDDGGDNIPYTIMLTIKCWEKLKTQSILKKCTFSSMAGSFIRKKR